MVTKKKFNQQEALAAVFCPMNAGSGKRRPMRGQSGGLTEARLRTPCIAIAGEINCRQIDFFVVYNSQSIECPKIYRTSALHLPRLYFSVSEKNIFYLWYLYQMATHLMLLTHGGKQFFSDKNILFVTALDVIKCLEQVEYFAPYVRSYK